MTPQLCKRFLIGIPCMVLFAVLGFAADPHSLNGTWVIIPAQSRFEGQPVIQSGTVTINDREHNIYISRNFTYDGAKQSTDYSFTTDGHENSTIRNGKNFRSKAQWDEGVLKVTTTLDNSTTVERYSLQADGTMRLVVEKPDRRPITLVLQRQ